jgi:hypothetical protein
LPRAGRPASYPSQPSANGNRSAQKSASAGSASTRRTTSAILGDAFGGAIADPRLLVRIGAQPRGIVADPEQGADRRGNEGHPAQEGRPLAVDGRRRQPRLGIAVGQPDQDRRALGHQLAARKHQRGNLAHRIDPIGRLVGGDLFQRRALDHLIGPADQGQGGLDRNRTRSARAQDRDWLIHSDNLIL